jgi:hypothetical protein
MNGFDDAATPLRTANRTRRDQGKEYQPARDLLEQVEEHLKSRHGDELSRMLPKGAGMDENFARLRTHYNNIFRYRELRATLLTSAESEFVERRLAEEHFALEALMSAAAQPCD